MSHAASNGTNRRLGENGTFCNIGIEDLGVQEGEFEFGVLDLGKFNTSVPFLHTFPFVPFLPKIGTYSSPTIF